MRIYQSDWGIETAGWSVDYSDGVLTLCPADADAALILSCFQKKQGTVSLKEMEAASKGRLLEKAKPVRVTCGVYQGYYGEYIEENAFWRNWFLANGKIHLFVTFNCDPEHRQNHTEVVDWMLTTLEAKSRS